MEDAPRKDDAPSEDQAPETTTGIYIKPSSFSSQQDARSSASSHDRAAGERELWITNFPSLTEPLGEEESFDTWEELCDTLRSFYESDDKKTVPGWSAARFVGGKRENENVREIHCVVFDYDAGTTSWEDADEFWSGAGTIPGTKEFTAGGFSAAYLMHTSYSHKSEHPKFRVILPLSRPVNSDEYTTIWKLLAKRAADQGHEIDEACKDPARMWFFPSCPKGSKVKYMDAVAGAWLDVGKMLKAAGYRAPKSASSKGMLRLVPKASFESEVEEVRSAPSGARHTTLNRVAFKAGGMIKNGSLDERVARDALRDAARESGLPPGEAETTIDRAIEDGRSKGHAFLGRKIQKTSADCVEVLQHSSEWSGVIRKNAFTHDVIFAAEPPFADGSKRTGDCIRDEDITRIVVWFERQHGVSFAEEKIWKAVLLVADQNAFHPVQTYLGCLTWDGIPRAETWLEDYCKVVPESDDQRKVVRAVAKRWLISCVARILQPGCKVDTMLILEGEQGFRKSSALMALASDEFFSDTPLDLKNKDSYQKIQGIWIYELAELDALLRAESSEAKAFLSSQKDRFRVPYGKAPINVPRSVVFCGTVNHGGYLKDLTGNRRYWTVKCSARTDYQELASVRDQLWAEAKVLYEKGEQWHLMPDEEALMKVEQEARVADEPFEEPIAAWLDSSSPMDQQVYAESAPKNGDKAFDIAAVLSEALRMSADKHNAGITRRVAAVLQHLGYEKKRVTEGGKRAWRYVRASPREGI